MIISFASRKLECQLSDERYIGRVFGDRGRKLMRRLDLLRAAECLADVPHSLPTRRHALGGKRAGHFAVDISVNWRLIFRPIATSAPAMSAADPDLRAITAIEIVAIEDYH